MDYLSGLTPARIATLAGIMLTQSLHNIGGTSNVTRPV